MIRQSNILILVLCFALVGCGSGSYSNGGGGGNSPSYATMQAGQWEFVLTPTSGSPINLEVNLTISNGIVSSEVKNTGLIQLDFANGHQIHGSAGAALADLTTSGNITNGVLTLTISSANCGGCYPALPLSGATVATSGLAVSGGTYTNSTSQDFNLIPAGSGTFSGYQVLPLNGTFNGTITGHGLTDQIAITVTQDANFGITASGTDLSPGVSTQLTIFPSGTPTDNAGGFSNVIGATIYANGTGANAGGSFQVQVFGQFNPAATQVTVGLSTPSGYQTGTLTKQ